MSPAIFSRAADTAAATRYSPIIANEISAISCPATWRTSFAIYCCSSGVTFDKILRSKRGGVHERLFDNDQRTQTLLKVRRGNPSRRARGRLPRLPSRERSSLTRGGSGNVQPASALDGLRRGERSTPNAQRRIQRESTCLEIHPHGDGSGRLRIT